MKRSLLMAFVAIGLVACTLPKKEYLRSFITNYHSVEEIYLTHINSANALAISYGGQLIGGYKSTGDEKEIYDAICVKYNDTRYNRRYIISDGTGPYYHDALATHFISVDIVSDADFDEEHPAGESLGDIVLFEARSFKPYIDNGYKGEESTLIKEYLQNITTSNQLVLLASNRFGRIKSQFYFETIPTLSKTHAFTVTMTADDGRVFSDTIEITFE